MMRADWAIVTAWQKLLLGVAMCLPIPALSLGALALPLPAPVHRAAVAIAEATQHFADVLTGHETQPIAMPLSHVPVVSSREERGDLSATRPALAGKTASVRVSIESPGLGAPERARTLGGAPAKRPTAPVSVEPARAPSAPATDVTSAAADTAETPPTPPAPAPAAEVKSDPVTEPSSRPADVTPEPAPTKPSTNPSPPPAPPPPPPAPPPPPIVELPLPPLPLPEPPKIELPKLPGLGG